GPAPTCCRARTLCPCPVWPGPFAASSGPRPPGSTVFPYTTLFRSGVGRVGGDGVDDGLQLLAHKDGDDGRGRLVGAQAVVVAGRSEEHTSELQSRFDLVCRLLLAKNNDDREPSTTANYRPRSRTTR